MSLLRQFRYMAVVMASLALLSGCQVDSSTSGDAAASLATVSLFAVRIGMTPDELNTAVPGAHCKPTVEHPACDVPSTALGTRGIDVQFSDNRVSSASAWGQINNGPRAVSRLIVEQLGPPRRQDPAEDWVAAETWAGRDGSELALTNDTSETINDLGLEKHKSVSPADFVLSLTSADTRAQRAQVLDRAEREMIADLSNTLGKYLTIEANGQFSLCGTRVGTAFNGHLGCPPSSHAQLLAETSASDCATVLNGFLNPQLPWQSSGKAEAVKPRPDVCVSVVKNDSTQQVIEITAAFPTAANTELSTLENALMSLNNSSQLEPSNRPPWAALVKPASIQFKNSLGDLLTIVAAESSIFSRGRERRLLTVNLKGQSAEDASFR